MQTFALLQEPARDWRPLGHEIPFEWVTPFGQICAFGLLAVYVGLLLRAALRGHRYRALRTLDEADRGAVSDAVRAAEKKTTGEIVVVVLERSDRHPGADWLAAVTTVFVGTAALVAYLPWDHPALLVSCQAALGAIGFVTARLLPDFKRHFIAPKRAAELAGEQAFQEFFALGVHRTQEAIGVLIFVSLLEHRVIVMGDRGIDAKVDAELWQRVDAAILAGVREKTLREGLVEGVRLCGEVLSEHFPWNEADRDELENHLVVRRE